MDDTIIILGAILSMMVLIRLAFEANRDAEEGRMPVFDTWDILLFIVSLALLLSIAAKLRHGYWPS